MGLDVETVPDDSQTLYHFTLYHLAKLYQKIRTPLSVCNMAAIAKDIKLPAGDLAHQVSRSLSLSISPTAAFHSPPSSYGVFSSQRNAVSAAAKQLKPFATEDVKILLLENVNQTGRDILAEQGYQVEFLKSSLPEDELIEKIR